MIAFKNKRVIIEEIKLIKFGKFKNYGIELSDGFNVIYGENESGKSTIQLFIKTMLYGMPPRKRGVVSDRDRAIPWGENYAEGVLRILADGISIEVRRRFGRTASGDRFEVCNALSGELVPEYTSDGLGEALLGVPCDIFEKTVWVRQGSMFMGGKDEKIAARLSNLQTSGDESISADGAIQELETRRRLIKAADRRSIKGRLDILLERQEECLRQRYALGTQLAQADETKKRLAAVKAELEDIKIQLEKAEQERRISLEAEHSLALRERLNKAEEYKKRLFEIQNSENYKKARSLKKEDVEKAHAAEEKISGFIAEAKAAADNKAANNGEVNQKKSVRIIMADAALTAVGIGGAITGTVIKSSLITAFSVAALVAGVIFLGIGIRNACECKNRVKKREEENKIKIENIRVLEERIGALRAEQEERLKNFGVKDASELDRLYADTLGLAERERGLEELLESCLNGQSFDELVAAAKMTESVQEIKTVGELDEIISQLRERATKHVADISALESKMAYEVKNRRMPADIDTELAAIKEEISDCGRRIEIIDETIQGIKETAEIWRTQITPQINERVNKIIDKLTGGRYNAARIAADYSIRVEADGNLVGADCLSFGTFDQFYFALRIAIADMICGGKLLFLDDSFIAFDDERIKAAVSFLSEYSKSSQVVLFTCQRLVNDEAGILGVGLTELKI